MAKMKDSGIEWIGQIPDKWKIARIKDVVLTPITTGAGESAEDYTSSSIRYIRISDFDRNGKIIEENAAYIPKSKGEKYIIPNGAILAATAGATVGKTMLFNDIKEICCYAGYLAKIETNEQKMHNRFLLYQMKSQLMDDFKKFAIKKSTIENISATSYSNMHIIVPSIEEQKLIADFLDEKCADIDDLYANIKKEIEVLEEYKKSIITEEVTKGLDPDAKMKDSGVEWIGEIPKDWKISKLKYVLSSPLMYGANESGEDFNEEYPRYIRITDIDDNHKLKDEGKLSLSPTIATQYLLADNDILFARSGATVGKTFLYKEEYGKAAFAGYLIKAHLNEAIVYPKYIYYSTLGTGYDNWKKSIFTQATIQNIGADKYATYDVPIPLIDEQQKIINYLDEKCAEIDDMIKLKKEQLEVLEQYKKSIIYEYVTGKSEVPDV